MAQRLHDLEDDRVAQRGIGDIKRAGRHHPLRELTRCHCTVHLELTDANVSNLTLLEEAMAHQIARTLLFRFGEQPKRRAEVGEIMLRLSDLRP